MDQLILVRHAEADWSVTGRFMGHSDRPLTDAGRRQAEALREFLAGCPAARVVSSDLRRARETATLAGQNPVDVSPAWREIDMGLWSGRCRTALQKDCPVDYARWRARAFTPPAAEPWDRFEERVADAVHNLRAASTSALVFTHSGVIRAILRSLVGKDLPHAVRHTSVTTISLKDQPKLIWLGHAPWADELAVREPPAEAEQRPSLEDLTPNRIQGARWLGDHVDGQTGNDGGRYAL